MNNERLISFLEQLELGPNLRLADLKPAISFKDNKLHLVLYLTPSLQLKAKEIKEATEFAIANHFPQQNFAVVLTNELLEKSNSAMTIAGVKKVILVAAGKGGVGKSTVSVMLARQLQAEGYKIGLLDADIHGPSLPTILNLNAHKPEVKENKFIPLSYESIAIMSIGFLLSAEGAIAWRGPMVSKALNQLLFACAWPDLDYLIIDMPPGTGDIHLSIAQRCYIDGAVIVTTPDKVAVKDVEKAIDLYLKLGINILGIVENMSYLETFSGEILTPFGSNGGQQLASKYNLNLLAKLPLIPQIENIILSEKILKHKIDFNFLKN